MRTISFDHALSPLPARKRIALIAHDGKKAEMCTWVRLHKAKLLAHDLVATGTTGALIEADLESPVTKCVSGPLGGDQQIGALIVSERLDMLIFFWDPLAAQPHDPDVKALLRIAALYEVPVACNRATADFLMQSTQLTQPCLRQQTRPVALPA